MTERLLIREITVDDVDALYALYEDSEITRFVDGLCEDREEERRMTKAYIDSAYAFYGFGLWVVLKKDTGEIIGRVGLTPRQIGEVYVLELGYLIGSRYQRQGYAYEACRAVMEYAAGHLDCEELSAFISPDNEASAGLIRKLGFEHVDRRLIDGEDLEWYACELCDKL